MKKNKKPVLCDIIGVSLCKKNGLKFTLSPSNEICIDLDWTLPGKSIYLSCDGNVLKESVNLFESKFGINISFETLVKKILQIIRARILSYISIANKAGKLVIGKNFLEEFIRKNKFSKKKFLIIQAIDASNREKFSNNFSDKIVEIFTSDEISDKSGKHNVKFMLVYDEFADIISALYLNLKKFEF